LEEALAFELILNQLDTEKGRPFLQTVIDYVDENGYHTQAECKEKCKLKCTEGAGTDFWLCGEA